MPKNSNKKFLALLFVVSFAWISVAYFTISERVTTLKNEKYDEISNTIKSELQVLIDEKVEAILIVAFTMAQNTAIKESLLKKQDSFDLNAFSNQLREYTSLKNVWFQVITPEGKSFYRSWSEKQGDDIKSVRLDVAEMIKNPKITSSISTGKFDLTFKSMVPIYSDGKLIGILEAMAKFNSIAIKMQKKEYDMVMLVNKIYKKQLVHAYTKKFINDYYVANESVKKEFLEVITTKTPEYFTSIKTFEIQKEINKLVTVYNLPDIQNNPMGHFVVFYDLNKIDISHITKVRDRLILMFLIGYILACGIFYYIYIKRYQGFVDKLNRELEQKVEEKTKELKKQSENLEHLAHHDSLTGLPNRLLFLDRLKQAIKYAKRRKQGVTILFLDLDRFKEINDTFGHDVGDKLLKEVAMKLQSCLREEDTIARLGGDEFTVILENITQYQVVSITKQILDIMQESVVINKQELRTTFSIGISSYPEDGDSSNILLRNADTAMYKAKDNGKNSYMFYNSKMTELAFERVMLENNLRRAIEEHEFMTYYQPKINATNGKIIGMEALVRWQHPELGLVPPSQFISLAEDIGLIKYIDQWMMMNSMKTIMKFKNEGIETGILSLNVSMEQLENKRFIEHLQELVDETGFNTKYLELEITESQIMKNPESAIYSLNNLRQLGIKISIDDFGTGYSSLSYLKRLPIDNLKIDRSFIKDAYRDEDDAAIVRVIIALAKSLKLSFIAEGVETREQLDFLLEEGCYNIQGYFYSRPLPQDEVREFLLKLQTK